MSEAEEKTSSAVRELGMKVRKEEKKVEENYYVKLATKMVAAAKETRLVEDDTQDTFLKGKIWLPALFLCISRRSWCGSCFPLPWSRWSSDQVSNSQVTRRAVIVRMFGIELFWSYCSYLSLFSLFSFWKVTISRTVVGVAYPGYRSLKALLTEDKADDMLWLRYWVLSNNDIGLNHFFPLGCPGGFYCAWAWSRHCDVLGSRISSRQDGLPCMVHGTDSGERQQCDFQPGGSGSNDSGDNEEES